MPIKGADHLYHIKGEIDGSRNSMLKLAVMIVTYQGCVLKTTLQDLLHTLPEVSIRSLECHRTKGEIKIMV